MAKSDPGPGDENLMGGGELRVTADDVIGSDLSESLDLDLYGRTALYSVPETVSGDSELYIMDPVVDHSEKAVKEFAGLFSDADLLVPGSYYNDVAYFIPAETGFRGDEHVETSWGYVDDERDKYFLISDN